MAVYRKKLVDKDGNTIIPAVGDIYGTVYNATLSTATAGDTARYDFTPDTPVENNKVYAVKFPAPTVNNATIILGDGVVSGSILVPPVSATDSPNYELLTTDMINDTEPLLLMYSGVQWVCLNQKKKVATADLEDKAVKSAKIDWTTIGKSSNHYIKFGDIVIQWGVADFGNQSFSTDFWGTFNRAGSIDLHFNYPIAFDEKPVLIMNVVDSNTPLLGICYAQNNGSGSRSPSFTVYVPKGFTTTANVKIQWVAIGVKK